MKIRPAAAQLFHGDKYRHDEVNSRFSQFCERVYNPRGFQR